MIREDDIGKKLFPDFPDMKVDFLKIGIGKIGLAPQIGKVASLKDSAEFRAKFSASCNKSLRLITKGFE